MIATIGMMFGAFGYVLTTNADLRSSTMVSNIQIENSYEGIPISR